jgi:hypothetical protein
MAIMRNKNVGLTIGMAVKSDMIGLYFTLQALRMYHEERGHYPVEVGRTAPQQPGAGGEDGGGFLGKGQRTGRDQEEEQGANDFHRDVFI